jgi:hypothetical protein
MPLSGGYKGSGLTIYVGQRMVIRRLAYLLQYAGLMPSLGCYMTRPRALQELCRHAFCQAWLLQETHRPTVERH